jgi:ATP-binding cassette subfamily B protein
MRENWRAMMLLVRTAVRTDPWRSLGLLLEPVAQLRFPLLAWFLKLLADGAVQQDLRLLAIGAVGITVTRTLYFVGLWTGSLIRVRLNEEVGYAFDRQIATLTSQLPGLEHHERPDILDRLEILRHQQGALGNSLNALINTANALVSGLGMLVALLLVSPWLLLLVPFALPALPFATLKQRWAREAEQRFGPPARLTRHLGMLTLDRNAGMEVRVFGLEREILSRFRGSWTESRRVLLAADRRGAVLDSLGDLLYMVGFAGAIVLMLVRAHRGLAGVGDVVMAVYLSQQVKMAVVMPVQSVAGLGAVMRAAARMLWLQDYARGIEQAAEASGPAPDRLRDGIVFENVGFRYPGTDRWALRNASFRVPAGAVVAVVGENGAGKTTLVKLLSRMYDPTEGRILVDGVDLTTIEVGAWRRRLSAAFQDFARLELTAQHAVGLGDMPHCDDPAAVHAALERAGAADVMKALPSGLQTQLGARWEGGVDLSGGQWQKLALGRALMRTDPLMVFFDEPTASLDAPTEHALFERYAEAAREGTVRGAVTVLVSHRFSTVRAADLILVIDGGRVSELGDHQALLENDGLYAELYSMQAQSYV